MRISKELKWKMYKRPIETSKGVLLYGILALKVGTLALCNEGKGFYGMLINTNEAGYKMLYKTKPCGHDIAYAKKEIARQFMDYCQDIYKQMQEQYEILSQCLVK